MKPQSVTKLRENLSKQLRAHANRIDSDPQANAIKLLAYDISKDVEERKIAFRDIEALVKILSDEGAIDRANRLAERAGVNQIKTLDKQIADLAHLKAKDGFEAFKTWAENPGLGVVLTAHPTFSLSRKIRDCLGAYASATTDKQRASQTEHLKTLPYLPERAPTLQEEHVDTQAAIERMQVALQAVHEKLLDVAKAEFPKQWTQITPSLANIYSWVGYDIDGRTDITWGDALRLRLSEKATQLGRYREAVLGIQNQGGGFNSGGEVALETLTDKLTAAKESAERDLKLFTADLSDSDNLVAAANNLTRQSSRRFLSLSPAYPFIDAAISGAKTDAVKAQLVLLRSQMKAYGLGTSRIHFRLNQRHVISGLKAEFGITDNSSDSRTLLERASKLTKSVKPQPVNFASLALEKRTAHQQMILTAQIHKYIDDETPIRFLIAETEDSLTCMGMLYLARRYGIDRHMDISPLFETADALNNGGRIIDKLLGNAVYRDYVETRGCFAIQTGFSDAGRFMGQIPATLAIERLQSHFAAAMAKHKVKDVTAIVFNTHGEGNGRGGHPGNIKARVDYVMSPWAVHQFTKRGIHLCHETSFQGGDGFMWFQTEALARATMTSLIAVRGQDTSQAEDDVFYTENDFSWDVYRTLSSQQDGLYHDNNYVTVLGGFGQNLLIPTGSRAAKRAKTGGDMFNPRQLRAIPHNAILQQMGVPANIFYGVGRAAAIDPEKFTALYQTSARARSLFSLVITSMQRANLSTLTSYGRLFDPSFWISRAWSNNEPALERRSLIVADTLTNSPWSSQITDLANRLRMDAYESVKYLTMAEPDLAFENDDSLKILHALRIAVVMKMLIIATDLPTHGDENTAQLNVLQKLQTFQINTILDDLKQRYPATQAALEWTEQLAEKTDMPAANPGGFPHIAETIIKPLERASQLVRQISVAITHRFDAFG